MFHALHAVCAIYLSIFLLYYIIIVARRVECLKHFPVKIKILKKGIQGCTFQ